MTEQYATFEARKDKLYQNQDGTWKLTLNVHPNDMPLWLLQAPMGQRIGAAALHEIGEDEKPVTPKDSGKEPAAAKDKTEGEKAVQRAALLPKDLDFQRWIVAKHAPNDADVCEDNAAELIRYVCGVKSRSELATNMSALDKFLKLETSFRYRNELRR